jgi:hypothetical protein
MTVLTDTDLYRRGIQTLPASWEEHARGVTDATVHRLPGVAAAVFTNKPEHHVYKNAFGLSAPPPARGTAPQPARHRPAPRRANDQPLDQRRGPIVALASLAK